LSIPQNEERTVQVRVWVPPGTSRQTTHLTPSASVQGQPELANSPFTDLVVGTAAPTR
jgi:hypothetical protein